MVVEPSDVTMSRDNYEKLLLEVSHERLTENSYEIMGYVYGLLNGDPETADALEGNPKWIIYRSHCR